MRNRFCHAEPIIVVQPEVILINKLTHSLADLAAMLQAGFGTLFSWKPSILNLIFRTTCEGAASCLQSQILASHSPAYCCE